MGERARESPAYAAILLLTDPPSSLSPAAIGRLCEKCDGKCVICDSYVKPQQLVRICDECNYGSSQASAPPPADGGPCARPRVRVPRPPPRARAARGRRAMTFRSPPASESQGRCVICGGLGVSDAYYCKECVMTEKDRDGCPKIINLGAARMDQFYEKKKYGAAGKGFG